MAGRHPPPAAAAAEEGRGLMHSARLQRVHALLSDGREHTTREIVLGAHVMAVSACVAELRANGCSREECRARRMGTGAGT